MIKLGMEQFKEKETRIPRPVEVKPLQGYRLFIKYSDGVEGIVDLSDLVGRGVFAHLKDWQKFSNVSIGTGGEIIWEGDVDICSDALYLKITGKKPEEIFPKLREVIVKHA